MINHNTIDEWNAWLYANLLDGPCCVLIKGKPHTVGWGPWIPEFDEYPWNPLTGNDERGNGN